MGKAVQGSALCHACPADIQRTSVSCTVNLSIMSSIMHRQQQEQQKRRQQNNPQKARATGYPAGRTAAWSCALRDGGAVPITCPLQAWPSHLSANKHSIEAHGRATWREDCRTGPPKSGNHRIWWFFFFAFSCATNTDRQTDKPKSRFKESTEAQDKLLWCYTEYFFPTNVSYEVKNF